MSKVEDEVCKIIQERAKKVQGTDKYNGATMEREDLTHGEWLEHLQHELMDAVIYVQRLRTRERTLAGKLYEYCKERRTIGGSTTPELDAMLQEYFPEDIDYFYGVDE
jgi:hypothetical protein